MAWTVPRTGVEGGGGDARKNHGRREEGKAEREKYAKGHRRLLKPKNDNPHCEFSAVLGVGGIGGKNSGGRRTTDQKKVHNSSTAVTPLARGHQTNGNNFAPGEV